MSIRNAAIAVFLLLAVGVGLAYFLGSGDGGAGRDAGSVRATGAAPSESARADAALARPEVLSDEKSAPESRVEVRETVDPALSLAPAATPAAEEDARLLRGRVLNPLGAPIADATVYVGNSFGALDYEAGESSASRFARRWIATTDADGRFELRGPRPGAQRMLVRKPGYARHEDDEVLIPDVESFELEPVVLVPGAILTGIVVDHVGRPVPAAELFVVDAGFGMRFNIGGVRERPSAVSGADGRFRLDELALGAWRVRVETKDHPDRVFEGLAERAGEIVEDLRFELEPGDTIAGIVSDVPPDERAKLEVRASLKDSADPFSFGLSRGRAAEMKEDGSFTIRGLRVGAEYLVQAREKQGERWGFTSRTRSARVPARAGDRDVRIRYQPEAAVLLTVVDDATDEPVEALQVSSGFRWREPLMDDDGRLLQEFPDGQVRVGNLRPDTDPAMLELEINAVGYEKWERIDIPVRLGVETDLGEIRLKPLPMVRVTVVSAASGAPIPGVRVTLAEETQEEGGNFGFTSRRIVTRIGNDDEDEGEAWSLDDGGGTAVTDEQGVALLNSLQGRRCSLRAEHRDYASAVVHDLYLPDGEAVEQTMKLGQGGSVLARVVDESGAPLAGVQVDHRDPERNDNEMFFFGGGRGGRDAVTDAAGEVTFAHLAPGMHRFRIHEERRGRAGATFVMVMDGQQEEEPGWQSVEVLEGAASEVVLVRTAKGTLTGRITEAGVDLAGASVRPERKTADERPPWARGMRGFGGDDGSVLTDSSGRYQVEDLEPGRYTLTITHPKRRMPADVDVDVEAGETRRDVDLPVSILEGRVTDLEGKPLAGVRVSAQRATGRGGGARIAMFRTMGGDSEGGVITLGDELGDASYTDSDGRYSLRGVQPDVELVVKGSGDGVQQGSSAPVKVAPDEVRGGVDLKLEAAGALEIEVLNADGSPTQFCMVRAEYQDEVPEGTLSDGADPKFGFVQNGSTKLDGMRPGRWLVSVDPAGPGEDQESPEDRETKVVAQGTGRLTFHMP